MRRHGASGSARDSAEVHCRLTQKRFVFSFSPFIFLGGTPCVWPHPCPSWFGLSWSLSLAHLSTSMPFLCWMLSFSQYTGSSRALRPTGTSVHRVSRGVTFCPFSHPDPTYHSHTCHLLPVASGETCGFPSACLPIHPSIRLSIRPPSSHPSHPSIHSPFTHLFIHPFFRPCI